MRALFKLIVLLIFIAWICAMFPKARALVEAPIQYAHGVASTIELFNLQKAIAMCKTLYERYPTRDEFERYVRENFDSRGRSVLADSWNTPYSYRASNTAYELRSAGPDRIMMTNDDLTISQKD